MIMTVTKIAVVFGFLFMAIGLGTVYAICASAESLDEGWEDD